MSKHESGKTFRSNSLFRYGYSTPGDIFNKAERERLRLIEASGHFAREEMCDHFFNFCVTAHALRDWCIKHLGASAKDKVRKRCDAIPVLACCRDIANSSKHFGLDEKNLDRAVTSAALVTSRSYVDVYAMDDGSALSAEVRETLAIDLIVDGLDRLEYVGFTGQVLQEWEALLLEWGIRFSSIFLRA